MVKPAMRKFLYCFSTRTGTILISLAFLIAIAPFFIFSVIIQFEYELSYVNGFQWLSDPLFKGPFVIVLSIALLLNAILLLGIIQRNHYMFLPWIIIKAIVPLGLIALAVFVCSVLIVLGVLPLVLGILGFAAIIAKTTKMPRQILRKCCGCADLRHGTLAIAAIGIKLCIVTFVGMIVMLHCGIVDTWSDSIYVKGKDNHIRIRSKGLMHTVLLTYIIMFLIGAVVGVACNAFLVLGVIKRREKILLPWLGFTMAVFIIYAVIIGLSVFIAGFSLDSTDLLFMMCILLLFPGVRASKMARPIFRHFCCNCGELRYGALGIAAIGIKFCLIYTISMSVSLARGQIKELIDAGFEKYKTEHPETSDEDIIDMENLALQICNGFLITVLIGSIIGLVFNILVVAAVIKRKHILLLPWICFTMGGFILYAVLMTIIFGLLASTAFSVAITMFILLLVIPGDYR